MNQNVSGAVTESAPITAESLKIELDLSIAEERYEDSARLRDELKAMKASLNV